MNQCRVNRRMLGALCPSRQPRCLCPIIVIILLSLIYLPSTRMELVCLHAPYEPIPQRVHRALTRIARICRRVSIACQTSWGKRAPSIIQCRYGELPRVSCVFISHFPVRMMRRHAVFLVSGYAWMRSTRGARGNRQAHHSRHAQGSSQRRSARSVSWKHFSMIAYKHCIVV